MSSEALQKVFKTFSDPTRLRILALLEREELAVQELMDILGMAQSRVSRHLAILREAGLLRDRRDGTYVFYRFEAVRKRANPGRETWELVKRSLQGGLDQRARRRGPRPASCRRAAPAPAASSTPSARSGTRCERSSTTMRCVAPWNRPPRAPGPRWSRTSEPARESSRRSSRAWACGSSRSTTLHACSTPPGPTSSAKEISGGRAARQGDVSALPLADAEVDAALAHMVLHYLPSPGRGGARDGARESRAGGSVVVVDFVQHHPRVDAP